MKHPRWMEITGPTHKDGKIVLTVKILWWHPLLWLEVMREALKK